MNWIKRQYNALYTLLASRFSLRKKEQKCVECSAYKGHSPNCSLIDFKEAKKQLTQYHKLWLEKETWVRKRSNFWRSDAERWKGKFMELKHENNALRRKVVKNNGS